MDTKTTESNLTKTLLTHYRSILEAGGETSVRRTLSAERATTSRDRQMTRSQKVEMLDALQEIEDELLPSGDATNSSKPRTKRQETAT